MDGCSQTERLTPWLLNLTNSTPVDRTLSTVQLLLSSSNPLLRETALGVSQPLLRETALAGSHYSVSYKLCGTGIVYLLTLPLKACKHAQGRSYLSSPDSTLDLGSGDLLRQVVQVKEAGEGAGHLHEAFVLLRQKQRWALSTRHAHIAGMFAFPSLISIERCTLHANMRRGSTFKIFEVPT